eukprot:15287605-Heterocapsa_arctica.AAC.1
MGQEAAEPEAPDGLPAPGRDGHGQHISAEERFSAMRCRIISRELAALPLDLSAVQATRKRILVFELDALEARAVRPRVQGPQPRPVGFISHDFAQEPPG